MLGHPIAKELEQFFREHNRFDDPQYQKFIGLLEENLAIKFQEQLEEHTNNGRFGMSKAGGCTRSVGIKHLGGEGEPLSGSTYVTFLIGHMMEALAIAGLESCGYNVYNKQGKVQIDPLFESASDGELDLAGVPTTLSVKSAGYKKSGKQGKGWVRRGFPELPFEGVQKAQPSWYAQLQGEMYGTPTKQGLVLVVAKDMIKAMEADPYLGPEGNGSLTFYAELIKRNDKFVEQQLIPTWEAQWKSVNEDKRPGDAHFLNGEMLKYVKLNKADTNWLPNSERTGTFNPCNYCDVVHDCAAYLAKYKG